MQSPNPKSEYPPVQFNHLYVTLSKQTVESIEVNEFLPERFSPVITQTVQADDESWTGTYLRGRGTYFEFFAPGGAEGMQEGPSGIGFSSQRPGLIDQAERKLRELAGDRVVRDLRVLNTSEGAIPWFHFLYLEPAEGKPFSPWLMDFHLDYLEHTGIALAPGGLLDKAQLMSSEFDAHRYLLSDIIEIHLDLSPSESTDLRLFLSALGIHPLPHLGTADYVMSECKLSVFERPDPFYRIREVKCSLNSEVRERLELSIDSDTNLSIEGELGIWEFGLAEHPVA